MAILLSKYLTESIEPSRDPCQYYRSENENMQPFSLINTAMYLMEDFYYNLAHCEMDLVSTN